MANKVTIKKVKNREVYNLSFASLTKGEFLSIYNALTSHSENSPVANDVLAYLENGLFNYNALNLENGLLNYNVHNHSAKLPL